MKELKVLSGVLLGAAAGFVIGLLIAPEEGKKTRKKILDEADKLADNLLKEIEEAKPEIEEKQKEELKAR